MSSAQAAHKWPWGLALLALLLLARLAPALLTPTRAFTYFFYDDSFYYEVPDALIAKPNYDALGYAYVSYLHDVAIGTLRLD